MRFSKLLFVLLALCSVGQFVACKKDNPKVVYREIPPPIPSGTVPPVPNPPPRPGFVDNDVFENDFLVSVVDVGEFDREFTRSIDACDTLNEGGDLSVAINAIDKTLNSISKETELVRTVGVGEQDCIRMFDLRDYGLTREDWRTIERADPWNIVSQTARGQLLIQLTQTLKPWLHAKNFLEVANSAEVYYEILEVPDNLNEFENEFLGCDFQEDFDNADKDLSLHGISNSQIALQKLRLFQRADCAEGFVWKTFDTDLNDADVFVGNINLRNLFEAPFPIEANQLRTFAATAHEYIALRENGTLLFALFAATGERQNAAPLTTVQDTRAVGKSLPGEIQNPRSCYSCHNTATIEKRDEVLTRVLSNDDYNNEERERASAYFNPVKHVFFAQDQQEYCSNIADIGTSCADIDTINQQTDDYRLEWDLDQLAAFFRKKPAEMADCVRSSAGGNAKIGQILVGSTVAFQDILLAKDDLIADCSLFNDQFGG